VAIFIKRCCGLVLFLSIVLAVKERAL